MLNQATIIRCFIDSNVYMLSSHFQFGHIMIVSNVFNFDSSVALFVPEPAHYNLKINAVCYPDSHVINSMLTNVAEHLGKRALRGKL